MTLSSLKTAIQSRFHVDNWNDLIGGETTVTGYINDIIDQIAEETDVFTSFWEITASVNQRRYSIPSDSTGKIWRVQVNNVDIDYTTRSNLSGADKNWEETTGTPTKWFWDTPDVIGFNKLFDEADTITLSGVELPDDLSGSSDTNFIVSRYQKAVVEGVIFEIYRELEDKREPRQEVRFAREIQKIIKRIKRAQGSNMGFRVPRMRKYQKDY